MSICSALIHIMNTARTHMITIRTGMSTITIMIMVRTIIAMKAQRLNLRLLNSNGRGADRTGR